MIPVDPEKSETSGNLEELDQSQEPETPAEPESSKEVGKPDKHANLVLTQEPVHPS